MSTLLTPAHAFADKADLFVETSAPASKADFDNVDLTALNTEYPWAFSIDASPFDWRPLLGFVAGVGQRLLPWVVPVLLLTLWQLSSSLGWLSVRVLPAPSSVLDAAWGLAETGELGKHVRVSAGRALLGLAVGGSLGLVLGLLTGSVRWLETLLDSTIQMIRNIPALALIPLVILWFGIEESAKLFLISVAVFFPIYINTFHGIRNVDPGLIEMGRTYGLTRWGLYRQIILPGATSSILVGLRFSLGLMWVILIVAETISAQAGIGYLTMNAREFLQTDVVLVGILLYAILGKLADLFAKGLEKYWLRWHPGYQ
jgi:sulfonate transport system permease protein